ncbi:glycosyltransferase family 4 protein [Photobacterium sp. 1_MG-2023]|uniref:glycosyltransferase family 4 protein n=1 Tax=Photobacterium sp. 1_MG-2023 TaxID=3062646 RepID=UPI0026E3CFE1|nr:glycosyltransferase family 4 protein [Photobacterium sp. 1_MG-2023]MDO6705895.1 glycosyltransferase family 4 protein [Photobacterium sp. 1_MG-2023]
MKILYHHRVASKDGQFVHIDAIIHELKQLGHEVILVAPKISEKADFGADGGWVSKIRRLLPGFLCELLEFGYSAYDFIRLCHAIIRHRPDVIYERYNLLFISGILAKYMFRLPLSLEVNAPLYHERQSYGGIHLDWLARWSELFVWRNADHVLPVSHVLATDLHNAGVPDARISVIPNGVDTTQFYPDAATKRPEFANHLIVGFAGFCREWHQLDQVLSLIVNANQQRPPEQPPILFLIIGDGPVLEDLQQQAQSLHATDQIILAGLASRENMADWLSQIDIALQPAVTPWCSPLKLLEYLATGKAIVAPDSENIRELLTNDENALLFQEGNLNEMLSKIEQLITDTSLRQRLSQNAAATIKDRHLTWQANAEKITAIFKRLTGKR